MPVPRVPVPCPPTANGFAARLLTLVPAAWPRSAVAETRDPYRMLVSEIMLQQTQVDRVLPKYHEWLERYPSFEALAPAPER